MGHHDLWSERYRASAAHAVSSCLGPCRVLRFRRLLRFFLAIAVERAEGVPDLHVHPLEPLAVRLTLSKTF